MPYDSTYEIKIQVENATDIHPDMVFKVVEQGEKFVDGTHTAKPTHPHVRKLSKDEYVVLSTGEILPYEHTDEKHIANLRNTFTKLRQLIRHNFSADTDNQLFLTLTYAQNMTDGHRLMRDYEAFMKRLRRKMKGHALDYIAVAEPQGRGAWHMHIMLKSDQPVLYIDNNKLADVWGHGFTKTKRLVSDDVGTYYAAYFTDLIPGRMDNDETTPDEKSKARIKGGRLHLYPKNFKFYRRSAGIEDPVTYHAKHKDIASLYGLDLDAKTYLFAKLFFSDDKCNNETQEVVNTITKISRKKKAGE